MTTKLEKQKLDEADELLTKLVGEIKLGDEASSLGKKDINFT